MLYLSFRMSTIKLAGVLAGVAVIAAAAAWEGTAAKSMLSGGSGIRQTATTASVSGTASRLAGGEAATNEQRVSYLKSLGWQVNNTPLETVEIVIPAAFNSVYKNYNAIQLQQGFDLSEFRGKRVKRWTYAVNNFPGVQSGVRANLLVYDGRVIGGDVSSVALNGFMQGLERRVSNAETGLSADKADIAAEMFKSGNS